MKRRWQYIKTYYLWNIFLGWEKMTARVLSLDGRWSTKESLDDRNDIGYQHCTTFRHWSRIPAGPDMNQKLGGMSHTRRHVETRGGRYWKDRIGRCLMKVMHCACVVSSCQSFRIPDDFFFKFKTSSLLLFRLEPIDVTGRGLFNSLFTKVNYNTKITF